MEGFDRALIFVTEKLKMIGAVFLFGMALLTCADVIGRIFKHPIFGSVELVSFMGVLAIAASLPFTHANKGHIGVELFTRKLSRTTRSVISLCTESLSLALFGVVAWRMFLYAWKVKKSGELSMNLQLPEYGIILILGCGFIVFTLTIINNIIKIISKLRSK